MSGLPQHPLSQKIARTLAGVVVIALVLLAVLVTVFDPFGKKKQAAVKEATAKAEASARGGATRRKELAAKREQLYEELIALERKRAAQQIDEDRFETNRQAVVSRLTLVLRELDQLDGATRNS